MPRNRCIGWKDGDIATYPTCDGSALLLGKVVIRKALEPPHRFYCKVEITKGGRLGHWDWPEGWVIGEGRNQFSCLGCHQDYRTDETQQDFCPPCNRSQRRASSVPETKSIAGTLRGVSTPTPKVTNTATAGEIAADIAARDSESPY